MTLLAVESACDTVGVALVRDDGASAERVHTGGRAHAELLIPSVEEVLAVSGCTIADVDVIAVDVGPGLFTGLRVGVATAKALGQGLSVGLVGLSSLDILAAAVLDRIGADGAGADGSGVTWEPVSTVVSVIDARRGEVFAAAYDFSGPGSGDDQDPADVCDDRAEALTPEELAAWSDDLAAAGPVLVVGDGAVRYRELLAPRPGLDLGLADRVAAPSPAVLARLAARRLAAGAAPAAPRDVVPDYRRHADAAINWEERVPVRTAPPSTAP